MTCAIADAGLVRHLGGHSRSDFFSVACDSPFYTFLILADLVAGGTALYDIESFEVYLYGRHYLAVNSCGEHKAFGFKVVLTTAYTNMLCAAFRIVFVNAVKGLDFYLVVSEHKSDETTFEFLEPLIVLNRFKAVGFSTFLCTLAVDFPHIFIVCFNEIGGSYQFRGMGIPAETLQHPQIVIPR